MKDKLCCTLALMVLAFVGFAVNPAGAATAAGPYYATPSWDQQLPASTRFIVLSNWGNGNEAVLDRETGLVWEQSPDTFMTNWFNRSIHCVRLNKGGRIGWRLPTIQELLSLFDPSVPFPGLHLPSGHPFTNVQSSGYWSATTDARNATSAWVVDFGSGFLFTVDKSNGSFPAWCVRGGPGVDPQ